MIDQRGHEWIYSRRLIGCYWSSPWTNQRSLAGTCKDFLLAKILLLIPTETQRNRRASIWQLVLYVDRAQFNLLYTKASQVWEPFVTVFCYEFRFDFYLHILLIQGNWKKIFCIIFARMMFTLRGKQSAPSIALFMNGSEKRSKFWVGI